MKQVGLNSTLYIHTEHEPPSREREKFVSSLLNISQGISGINLVEVTPAYGTPGIPPSSAESFLSADPSIPAIVLTDHPTQYINKYYNSIYDTTIMSSSICASATLLARTLWIEAGGDIPTSLTLHADCDFLSILINCWITDIACSYLLNRIQSPPPSPTIPSHHSSFFVLTTPDYTQWYQVWPAVLMNILESWLSNHTGSSVNYHDAVDPALVFDYSDSKWEINSSVVSPVWARSNWNRDLDVRFYRVETQEVINYVLYSGLALAFISVIGSIILQRWMRTKFKQI